MFPRSRSPASGFRCEAEKVQEMSFGSAPTGIRGNQNTADTSSANPSESRSGRSRGPTPCEIRASGTSSSSAPGSWVLLTHPGSAARTFPTRSGPSGRNRTDDRRFPKPEPYLLGYTRGEGVGRTRLELVILGLKGRWHFRLPNAPRMGKPAFSTGHGDLQKWRERPGSNRRTSA